MQQKKINAAPLLLTSAKQDSEWKHQKQKTEKEISNLFSANKSGKNTHRGTDGQKM